jgi:hypothetical protein
MTFFEYVSVLVSVVLALGVAQILRGVGAFLVARDRPHAYWLHIVWLVFLTLFHVQVWWVFWDLRSQPPATILAFAFTLVVPALAYLLSYVLLEGRFPSNARDHFDRVRRPFFALFTALMMCELLWPWVLGYGVPLHFRMGGFLLVGVAAAGFFTQDRRVHGVIGVYFLLSRVWLFAVRFQAGAFTPE